MSTYLIDFENVKSGGLAGIDHIRKEDSVHLFWSARENKISIEMMEMIRSSESEIVMHKAVTGERDALDHQLCSYLGFLAGARGETDFVIVSNDKAYDHLIEFWRRMDDKIHICRVPEISRISEIPVEETKISPSVLPAGETVLVNQPVSAEKTVPAEKIVYPEAEGEEAETAAFEVRGGKNHRRRERSGKYLKGGRSGRGNRRNAYMEDRMEEVKPAEQVRESAGEAAYAAVQPAVEVSPAAYVVTGIKTVLVESGFTADGILENRNNSQQLRQTDEIPAAETEAENEKTPEAQIKPEPEKVPEAQEEAEPEKKQEIQAKPEPEEVPEAQEEAEPEKKQEIQVKPEAEEAGKAQEEAEPEKEQEIQAKPEPEEVPEAQQEAKPGKEPEDGSVKENVEASEGEDAEEQTEAEKKTRTRSTRPANRKRGRPPKKEHTEHFPEIKIPIIESDVISKCEEAAGADWTGEVVRLINQSRDKKELYSAIVKLLGQEKGRTVYHAIKVLK